MKTYNFKPEFAGMVERGEKTQTIRATGKRTPPFAGEQLRFFTGMRTKQCRKLADGECVSCLSIQISAHYIAVGGRMLHQAEADTMARKDGFINAAHLLDWFKATHSLPFEGWLVTWRKLP